MNKAKTGSNPHFEGGIGENRAPAEPPLMPWPSQMALAGSRLAPSGLHAGADSEPALVQALARVNAMLSHTGEPSLPISFDVVERNPGLPSLADDESYRLEIASDGVTVKAPTVAGARHALTTLEQLAAGSGTFPIGSIEDRPRFPWRGLMLDVARHFVSPAALLQVVDAMAFFKLNVLHLHLTDDQGFRFRSDSYPRLASADSYSTEQLRELVGRAASKGIRVVPELDMPGHVTSWLVGYPDWAPPGAVEPGSDRETGNRREAGKDEDARPAVADSTRFGPHPAVLNVADLAVYRAIDTLFGELAEVFPDPYVHIGGDEVLPGWWQRSAEVRTYMNRHGLADAVELQAHFNMRVAAIAARHGRKTIGWDEVLNGGAPAGMTVQAWRGATARDRALAAGHPCIESAGYYLDLFFPADVHHAWDPRAPLDELLAREDALLEDPRFAHVAEGMKWTHQWREIPLTPQSGEHSANDGMDDVLGGEACLWAELVDERLLPVRLWSRMPAVAERLWSEAIPGDDISARLEASLDQLAAAGLVAVKQTSRRLLVEFGVRESQLDAVELLEPVKWYGRLLGAVALQARIEGAEMPTARPYETETPLNRPVDALLPESFAARRFTSLLNGQDGPLRQECKRLLKICRAGKLAADLEGPMDNLAQILTVVLDVLDGRIGSEPALHALTPASEPCGDCIVAIAPAVRAWLRAR